MPRPLRVGVKLPEVEYVATWPQQREMARMAAAIGLELAPTLALLDA